MESTEKGRLSIESIGIFRPALRSLLWGQVPTVGLQLVQRHTSEPRSPAGAITKAEFWPKPKDVTISGHAVHSGLEGGFQYRHVERNQFLPGWITRRAENWDESTSAPSPCPHLPDKRDWIYADVLRYRRARSRNPTRQLRKR